jgi:glycine/D-amino acid oxidase-like deaminating enzyme
MTTPLKSGELGSPSQGGIVIIGSGLSGASAAYWLKRQGFDDITILDFESEKAATHRNCGHILYGTVESMKALAAIHGLEAAKDIWRYSIEICHDVRETIRELGIQADYRQDGYLVIAMDDVENHELLDSINILNEAGFASRYITPGEVAKLGFKHVSGARFEDGSAQAHPVKFRNGLIDWCLKQGVRYFSNVRVESVEEIGDHVELSTSRGKLQYDAAVIAANAYSPLLSSFFDAKRLVEPFKGQIITSQPLKHEFKVRYPHSFDHGYEYALITEDNRLMIGGWRNHTPYGEIGTYDILPNPLVENGLKQFVKDHYCIDEDIDWEFSWSGIMAASKTGFPFIGATSGQRIFTCAGYTGHGFSWAHGSAKLLAKIMAGEKIPAVARYFNPKLL